MDDPSGRSIWTLSHEHSPLHHGEAATLRGRCKHRWLNRDWSGERAEIHKDSDDIIWWRIDSQWIQVIDDRFIDKCNEIVWRLIELGGPCRGEIPSFLCIESELREDVLKKNRDIGAFHYKSCGRGRRD